MQLESLKDLIKQKVIVRRQERPIIQVNGISESECLFDFRNILLDAQYLNPIIESMKDELKEYTDSQFCGLESAAIPLVTGLVLRTSSSGFYIRKSRKKTGLLNLLEGNVDFTKGVIIIDDIMNSSSSIMRQVLILESLGIKILAVCSILRYHPKEWYTELNKRNIKIHSLITHDELASFLGIPSISHDKNSSYSFDILIPRWFVKKPNPAYQLIVSKSTPCVDNERIYVGMDDGAFYCFDISSGKELWKYQTSFGSQGKRILSSPCIHGDLVFFGAYDGNLYALNKFTGIPLWINHSADWIGSSPCILSDKNALCVGMEYAGLTNQGGFSLFNIVDGSIIWSTSSMKYTHGSPIYSTKNNSIYGGSNDGLLYRIDADSGNIMYVYDAGAEIKSRPSLNSDETLLAFGSFSGELTIIDAISGKKVTSFQANEYIYSEPFWFDDIVYFSSLDKNIYAFNVRENKLIWNFATAGRVFAGPVKYGNNIYCGSNDGCLYVIDALSGTLKKKWLGIERITNPVVFINEENYILRTFANEIYLF